MRKIVLNLMGMLLYAIGSVYGGELLDNPKLISLIEARIPLSVITQKIKDSDSQLSGDTDQIVKIQEACTKAEMSREDSKELLHLVMQSAAKNEEKNKHLAQRFIIGSINYDEDEYSRIMREVLRAGKSIVPYLLLYIDEESHLKRAAVLDALSKIKDQSEKAMKIAYLSLQDRHPAVRNQAAVAVAALAGMQTYQVLINALNSKETEFSDGLIIALGHLGNPEAIPQLVNVLKFSVDRDARLAAAFALGKLRARDKDSNDQLLSAILDDKDIRLRVAAARALGQIDNKKAVNYIRRSFERYEEGRPELISELRWYKSVNSIKFLINCAEADRPDIRKAAIATLQVLTGEMKYDTVEEFKTWLFLNQSRPDLIESDQE